MNKIFFNLALVFLIMFQVVFVGFAHKSSELIARKNEGAIIEIPSLEVEGEDEEELEQLLKSLESEQNEMEDETTKDTSSSNSSFSLIPHQFQGGIACIERDFHSHDFFYV